MEEKLWAFTLDLESDYAGLIHRYGIFECKDSIERLLENLLSLGIKITVFSVGEVFERYPQIISLFSGYQVEFEVHSYTHNLMKTDSHDEIGMARDAYYNFFKRYPSGYRAPQGRISYSGIKRLESYGFKYDSSVFPSYYPNPLRYLAKNRQAHYLEGSQVVELPFTSVSPMRITLSISYIKLMGFSFFRRLLDTFGVPNVVCFDSHLHDFIVNEDSYDKLPFRWKLVYSRNKYKGLDYFCAFFDYIKSKGYRSCFMSELYNIEKERIDREHSLSRKAKI